jgi:hypothetical protein
MFEQYAWLFIPLFAALAFVAGWCGSWAREVVQRSARWARR